MIATNKDLQKLIDSTDAPEYVNIKQSMQANDLGDNLDNQVIVLHAGRVNYNLDGSEGLGPDDTSKRVIDFSNLSLKNSKIIISPNFKGQLNFQSADLSDAKILGIVIQESQVNLKDSKIEGLIGVVEERYAQKLEPNHKMVPIWYEVGFKSGIIAGYNYNLLRAPQEEYMLNLYLKMQKGEIGNNFEADFLTWIFTRGDLASLHASFAPDSKILKNYLTVNKGVELSDKASFVAFLNENSGDGIFFLNIDDNNYIVFRIIKDSSNKPIAYRILDSTHGVFEVQDIEDCFDLISKLSNISRAFCDSENKGIYIQNVEKVIREALIIEQNKAADKYDDFDSCEAIHGYTDHSKELVEEPYTIEE